MNIQQKKTELIDEFNKLETRQREIIGALQILEEQEKEIPKEAEKKEEKKEEVK